MIIFLGTVVVQPEPVLNEDKDDFKGPEFRNRNTTKLKPETQKKRGGKCNTNHFYVLELPPPLTIFFNVMGIEIVLQIEVPSYVARVKRHKYNSRMLFKIKTWYTY